MFLYIFSLILNKTTYLLVITFCSLISLLPYDYISCIEKKTIAKLTTDELARNILCYEN